MNVEQMTAVIAEANDDLIYLSDPETYDLLYLSRAARDLLGVPHGADLGGMKCHWVIHWKDSPCEFCTNRLLSTDRFYTWEQYHAPLNRHLLLRDKLVRLDEKCVRMEIATDITEKERAVKVLSERLSVEDALVQCINTLNSGKDVDTAINSLLLNIGAFYGAERAYIFELDDERQLINNTYEWCREGVTPQLGNSQALPLSAVDRWMEAFARDGWIIISSVGGTLDPSSLEYQILEAQGIESLIAVPLVDETGSVIGFIGVDNPAENLESAQLLTAISNFVVDDLDKRMMLAQLERMSYQDALTGLNNRNRYLQRLQELQKLERAPLGVVFMDINGLKRANDTYGHTYGDLMIVHAAGHLKQVFGNDVYRIGGDEFVALCAGVEREEFERLTERLSRLVEEDENCSISIGAKWDGGESGADDLIAGADELMYINKQSYYQTSLGSMPRHRALFVRELVKAIKDGTYVVLLQPKVELKSQRIYGAEALVRRRESDGSLASPGKFISLLEAEGAIRYIDFFVLETVCRTLGKWKRDNLPLLRMAVNFSRITLMEKDVIENMLKVCDTHGVEPKWITIEVTESIGRMDIQSLKDLIIRMTEAGFSISLDDFGSQYSNLAILASIDFDELKFDKSLIENIALNEKSSTIIRHAIDMGKTLNGTSSVAEGIETPEQLALLEGMDCDYGQGFLFSGPVSIEEFQTLLQKEPD